MNEGIKDTGDDGQIKRDKLNDLRSRKSTTNPQVMKGDSE